MKLKFPRNNFFLLLVLLSILFTLLYVFYYSNDRKPSSFFDYQKQIITIRNKTFFVYLADSDDKRIKGLSGVKKLKNNEGMMFVWNYPDYYYFWMKDMKFSLDFVFIKNNTIVDIKENVEPNTFPHSFTSREKSDKVIEFTAGTIKKNNLQVGDFVSL